MSRMPRPQKPSASVAWAILIDSRKLRMRLMTPSPTRVSPGVRYAGRVHRFCGMSSGVPKTAWRAAAASML